MWGNSAESVVIKSFASYIHTFNMLKMITVKDKHHIEHRQGHKCMIMRPFGVQYHSYLIIVSVRNCWADTTLSHHTHSPISN